MAAGGMARGGALAAASLLAGCGLFGGDSSPVSSSTAPCPRVAILADGADLSRFRPGSPPDLTTQTLDARIAGFQAQCDWGGRDGRRIDVTLTPLFTAERGPAAEGRVVDLPWFIALTGQDDSNVLARDGYVTRVTFPANAQRTQQPGQRARVSVPLAEGQRAGEFNLRISFQLTPDELALNRRRGPR